VGCASLEDTKPDLSLPIQIPFFGQHHGGSQIMGTCGSAVILLVLMETGIPAAGLSLENVKTRMLGVPQMG
jgi:hypothetical protein